MLYLDTLENKARQYNPQLLPTWLEKGNISYMHSSCLDNSHYKKVINK